MTTAQTAGDATVFTITGAADLETADATDGIILVNLTGNIADTDALELLEMGGDALTVSGDVAIGDAVWPPIQTAQTRISPKSCSVRLFLMTANRQTADGGKSCEADRYRRRPDILDGDVVHI